MQNDAQNRSCLVRREPSSATRVWLAAALAGLLVAWPLVPARGEECFSGSDIEPAVHNALEHSASSYYQMAMSGDFAGLKQSSTPSLASDFSGIEQAVASNHDNLQGSQATQRAAYLLSAPGDATIARAEFFCGIFNSPERVTFVVPNLPPGRYAVVIDDVSGGKQPVALTLVLNQQGGSWKLAGLTIKPRQAAGHDSSWFLTQAEQYRQKGDNFTAWLYYLEAWDLAEPVNFMYTTQRDRIADALQPLKPADPPSKEHPMLLALGAETYRVIDLYPDAVGSNLALVVKYEAVTDVSNTAQTFAANSKVIKAVVDRFPALRAAFDSVVARAVDASGRDYGTLLALKDVK